MAEQRPPNDARVTMAAGRTTEHPLSPSQRGALVDLLARAIAGELVREHARDAQQTRGRTNREEQDGTT